MTLTTNNGTTDEVVDQMVIEMKEAQAKKDGPQPVFDFSNLSFGQSGEMGLASADYVQASISNNRKKILDATNQLRKCFARVLVSVPREWLVKEAPEEIDWSNPESIEKWLLAIKAGPLREAYNTQFTEASKN